MKSHLTKKYSSYNKCVLKCANVRSEIVRTPHARFKMFFARTSHTCECARTCACAIFFRNSQFTEKVEVETQKLLEMQKAETEAQKLLQQQQAEAEMKQFIRQQQVEAQQLMQEQTVNNPLFDDLLKYYSNL